MPHAVGNGAGGIPAVDAEVGIPAWIPDWARGHRLPAVAAVDLKARLHRLAGLERKELCGQLERGVATCRRHVDTVDRKGDHRIPRHGQRKGAALGLLGPPGARRPAVERGHVVAKWRRGTALRRHHIGPLGSGQASGEHGEEKEEGCLHHGGDPFFRWARRCRRWHADAIATTMPLLHSHVV